MKLSPDFGANPVLPSAMLSRLGLADRVGDRFDTKTVLARLAGMILSGGR
jgi:hypothetical protein